MNTTICSATAELSALTISAHAVMRARQRLGWTPKSTRRMALKALAFGKHPSLLRNDLRVLMETLHSDDDRRVPYLHGEVIFVFARAEGFRFILLTIYRADQALLRSLRAQHTWLPGQFSRN